MKVCTDACLFGAWVAHKASNKELQIDRILDIGTGTGLLSLMLAQKVKATIGAIEIDDDAAQQAQSNFNQTKYKDRLHVVHQDIRTYHPGTLYDLIISNPPFFENNLKSEDQQRNLALHSPSLTLSELIVAVKKLLSQTGMFAILLPYFRAEAFITLAAKHDLLLQQQVLVQQTESHQFFRSMLLFSLQQVEATTSTIMIKKERSYSNEFSELLKDYYLFL